MAATILASCALAATPAMAQDDDSSGISVSGNAAIVTDYRFRGLSLSHGDIAVQGGIDVETDPGFYVGVWGSNIDSCCGYGELELDVYGGWSGDITEGLGADVGVIYYLYPDDPGLISTDYLEVYASLSPTLGPVGLTFGVAYAFDQGSLGNTDNIYLYTDAEFAIPETPITIAGHVGYTDGALALSTFSGNAFDYSIGASVEVLGGLTFGVAYVGVESDAPEIDGFDDETIVGTLSFSF
jgi:uncharacterized protein (TIGR02001 family)